MRKWVGLLVLVCLLISMIPACGEKGEALTPDMKDSAVMTRHSAVIDGQTLDYTATAGHMVLDMDGSRCAVYYTAYTLDGIADLGSRPVTFAFNGGPAAAAMWMQMALMGPRRVELGADAEAQPRIIDNEYSFLSMTDLVFIDPVGTGYSRPLPGSDISAFIGYSNDIAVFSAFIRRYVEGNGRVESPKYLAGESYGTTRAVGLCYDLMANCEMNIAGLMLVSSMQDYSFEERNTDNDLIYAVSVPAHAAVARHHGKIDEAFQKMPMNTFMAEVRSFVEDVYVPALFKGSRLSEEERMSVARRLAAFTGLTAETYLENNLRVSTTTFRYDLLGGENLILDINDGRKTYPMENKEGDAGNLRKAVSDVTVRYFADELGFDTDLEYLALVTRKRGQWHFTEHDNEILTQESIIREIVDTDPKIRIWVLCGYYDLNTKFYQSEYVFDHALTSDGHRRNLRMTYYEAGHMIYLDPASFAQLRRDAEGWFAN